MLGHRLLPVRLLGVAAIALAGACSAQAQTVDLDVPFVPTPQDVVDRMLQLADVGPDDYLIDLGSGDGRIPITAAREHGTTGMGVDLNPQRVEEAEANAKQAGVEDKVDFHVQDLYETDIGEATVLSMYLLPQVNLDLRPRILEELDPGTRVVSHAFDMGDWEPDAHESVGGRQVFLWVVPAHVAGQWQVETQDGTFTMTLNQNYQRLDGYASGEGGSSMQLQEASLTGNEIRFTVDPEDGEPREFAGRVEGNSIEPLDDDASWRAMRTATAEAHQGAVQDAAQ